MKIAAGGRFVFESRNPAIDWANRWDYAVNDADAGGHVGQFRQDRHLGNMTANKGRRSLSVVGNTWLLVRRHS